MMDYIEIERRFTVFGGSEDGQSRTSILHSPRR